MAQLSLNDQSILELILGEQQADPKKFENRQLTANERAVAEMEAEAIYCAEHESSFEKALQILDQAVLMAPDYPSPRNNRAQIYRLVKRNDEAMQDLDKCIQLCGTSFPTVLRQALTQRAWLLYLQGREEEAFVDFEQASELGSTEARKMAVRCNPYGQLCASILQQTMAKLYSI